MRVFQAIGLTIAVTWAGSASALDFRSACNTASLCSGVEPGGGRIIRCLKEHKDKLSTKCKTAIGEFFLNQPIRSANGQGGGGRGGAGAGAAEGGGGEQGAPGAAGGDGGGAESGR